MVGAGAVIEFRILDFGFGIHPIWHLGSCPPVFGRIGFFRVAFSIKPAAHPGRANFSGQRSASGGTPETFFIWRHFIR
jgi:hypothetical protein